MDKKNIDLLQSGWTWGRAPFASAQELAAQLAKEIVMPLAPLSRKGKAMVEAQDVQAWMFEQGWGPESIGDAGYFWRVNREGFAARMAPTLEDAERLWSAMLSMAALQEAQELGREVASSKPRRRKANPRI